MAHTPGPWSANDIPNAPERDFRFATAVWLDRTDEGERSILICSVAPDSFQEWQPNKFEQTANAKLIAAAPALLAACEAAVKATGGSAIWNGETKLFLEKCEAAIQLARGA